MSRAQRRRSSRAGDTAPALPDYLRRRGISPRRALGQHFLVDEFAMGDIARACEMAPGEVALEIGAGPGGLTEELLAVAERVVAVELDEELAALTRERLAEREHLVVLAADILDFAPIELLVEAGAAPPYVAVGNLPYYITQPVIRRLLESDPAPERVVVMVQREVARRIVGGPGRESMLAMATKFYGEPEYLFDVPAESFWPPPRVQSAVVRIRRRPRPPVEIAPDQRELFFHLMRAGFASPRKQLHNALPTELGLSNAAVTEAMTAAAVDPATRAQHLDFADWERLFRVLIERHPDAMHVHD